MFLILLDRLDSNKNPENMVLEVLNTMFLHIWLFVTYWAKKIAPDKLSL